MVKVCASTYPKKDEIKYAEHFEKYSFPLSSFQKYALEAIVEGHHILVTAHTGSGKTLPAEFAIEHFVAKGKKVIYTSPIKALSNQKYYEFREKFPGISFGILTGDIKSNPEADVLIMTTEILQNTLYKKKHKATQLLAADGSQTNFPSLAMFDMDIDVELGAVVFDEVHYINDQDRGKVWEETIMMLPLHIQMVMLSATLDAPEKFALWCETRGLRNKVEESESKTVYLTTTYERVVPLTHYSFITTTQGVFKAIKDKELEKQIREITNKPFVIQTAKGVFDEVHYHKMNKMLKLFESKNVFTKRSHVINQVCKHMVENEMLPAICFVLSRKQLEICAKEVTVPLLEFDSKVGYIARRECEQIIRRLPNYEEYLQLPEYNELVALLEKGIAIHHAGIMPVLREMVELLFAKGFVKLLFATETFAVGINMPTKTVVFTDINKFDGSGMRILHSHEFTQMAGRAGRRGIDTVGNVIHLNNLFKNMELTSYKTMMQGKPQKLVSKFKISYNLLLNLIDIGDQDFLKFVQRSMIQEDIEIELGVQYYKITEKEREIEMLDTSMQHLRTPQEIVQRYIHCVESRKVTVNKKRKELDREVQSIQENYKNVDADVRTVAKYNEKCDELEKMRQSFHSTEQFLGSNVTTILEFLEKDGFITKEEDSSYKLSIRGFIATHLREIHCLVFAKLLEENKFDILDAKQLIGIFSCFTNVTVADEQKSLSPAYTNRDLQEIMGRVASLYDYYQDFETLKQVNTGIDYEMHYDLIDYTIAWAECESAPECKTVLQKLEKEKGVFLGEFVKAILKINNIASEMEKIAESIGNIALLSKLREIPALTQKFVATNQSLYV
jgi:superfamily II RNA helicase